MGASSAKTGPQWGRRGLDLSSRLEQRTYAPYVMRISMRSEHAVEWSAYRVSSLHAVPFVALDLPSTFGDREESGNTQAFLGVLKLIIFIIICCSFTGGLLILNLSLAVCQFVQLCLQDWDPYTSVFLLSFTNKMRNYLFRYSPTHDCTVKYCLRVNHRIEPRMHLFSTSLCIFSTLTFDARRIPFDFHSCRIEFLRSPFVRSIASRSSFFRYRQ